MLCASDEGSEGAASLFPSALALAAALSAAVTFQRHLLATSSQSRNPSEQDVLFYAASTM